MNTNEVEIDRSNLNFGCARAPLRQQRGGSGELGVGSKADRPAFRLAAALFTGCLALWLQSVTTVHHRRACLQDPDGTRRKGRAL